MPRFRLPYILLTVLYCAAIFYLSAQSSLPDRAPSWLSWPGSDKIAHAIIYAGLGAIVYIGLVRSNAHLPARLRAGIPIAFAVLYGLSDEVHQVFVPNRGFDVLDLLANAAGATILVVALEFWRHRICVARGNSRPNSAIQLQKGHIHSNGEPGGHAGH